MTKIKTTFELRTYIAVMLTVMQTLNSVTVIAITSRVVLDITIENLFRDHRIICLMKLMVSTMPSAAIKMQYIQCFHCLPVFDEVCGMAIE